MKRIRHYKRAALLLATITICSALCAQTLPRGSYSLYASPPPAVEIPTQQNASSSRPIGTLGSIIGPNAYYMRGNAGQAVYAYEGLRVYEGDRIFTGAGTRMILRFDGGGYAELDENTDPVPHFLIDFSCMLVDLLRSGRMFVNGSNVCVGAQGTLARQNSQVVYDVRIGYAQITVAGGQAEMVRPQRALIPAGYRVDATAERILWGGSAYPLARKLVEEAVNWTRWYQQEHPVLPGVEQKPAVIQPGPKNYSFGFPFGIFRSFPGPEDKPSEKPPYRPPEKSSGTNDRGIGRTVGKEVGTQSNQPPDSSKPSGANDGGIGRAAVGKVLGTPSNQPPDSSGHPIQ